MKCKKMSRLIFSMFMVLTILFVSAGCSGSGPGEADSTGGNTAQTGSSKQDPGSQDDSSGEKNGEIYILFTSDVHCGVDQGFSYAGLRQIRDQLEAKGYETILVDDGDAIQGEAIGTLTKGEAIIEIMNELEYDVAIPGNHEFDYGMDNFLSLADKANFPYVCCNFNHEGSLVFSPYVIKEAAGRKIAFVGVTTPTTITSSTPSIFQNEKEEYVYDFLQDESGEKVYEAVQTSVDSARAEGADYVYVIGHLGNVSESSPWTYADVISHTSGIDVFLDGHSHDTDQVVMKDKEGKEVVRQAPGTKLSCIGYSHISNDGEILETGIWSWSNKESAPEILGIQNETRAFVDQKLTEISEELNKKVASTREVLTINDPEEKDNSGNPIRMIRRGETNLGDLCADAVREQTEADIGLVNGGGIRVSIDKGDITYKDIIDVHPFGNTLTVVEVTGQTILDALEWGAHALPEESGGFLQVSGMTYQIDTSIDSPCIKDRDGMLKEIKGPRRVSNVMVDGKALEPDRKYKVGGYNYSLLEHGDGQTAFDGAELILSRGKIDNQVMIDYIRDNLGGEIGEEYADPYGQGRITILDGTDHQD